MRIQTYGIELISKDGYEKAMDQWHKSGGCTEQLIQCQKQARENDPDWQGNIPSVVKCFKDLKGVCPTLDEVSKGNNVRLSNPLQLSSSLTDLVRLI